MTQLVIKLCYLLRSDNLDHWHLLPKITKLRLENIIAGLMSPQLEIIIITHDYLQIFK